MSLYQGFNTKNTSNVFNSNDIVSFEEQSSGGTTVSLDLSSFVQKNAPVFDNQLYLSDGVGLNFNGKIQNTGFTDEFQNDLEQTKNKTTNVSFSNDVTTISNTLDLQTSTVQFTDEHIPQSKITNLVSRLTEIDANLASINSNDVDIQNLNNLTATHSTDISAIQSLDAVQNGRLDVNEVEIENIKLNIVEVEGNVAQNLTNNTNNLTSINNLNTLTTTHTNDIINLQTVDTNLANDIATNLATYTAYTTSNDAKNVEQDGRLSSVESLNITQDSRLDAIDTLNSTQNDRLDAVETLNSTQAGRLDDIDTLNLTQNGRLDAVETHNTSQDSNIASLTAISSSNNSAISALQSHNLVLDASVNSLEAEILTKHPTINSGNKLLASLIGNGDVNNSKLSSLNNIRTDVSIQNQINTLETNLATLDGLQDLDLVNIPTLQNDVSTLQSTVSNNKTASDANDASNLASINSNTTAIASNTTNIASNLASINSNTTAITNNANSISTINTNVTALVNADTVHSSQITDLQNADTVLQSNIDLKQNIIDLTNKLDSTKIFDTALNDSLDAILSTIDSNISILNSSKQDNITTLNKLNSSLLNRDDNLLFCDATSSIQGQINAINSNISLLQGVDTTIIDDIQSNFDTHDTNITANTNAISTLQGLQNGDVVSFNSINSSITNLTNTKHPLIDNSNKLNSSLINRDDNLQHVDVTSSINTSLNNLQTNVDSKQNIIDNSNKLNSSYIDLTTTNLQYADYGSSVNSKFASLDTQISTLNATDVSQTTTNTNLQTSINTNASDISNLQTFETNQGTTNTNLQNSITNLETFETTQGTTNTNLQTSINTNISDITDLQTSVQSMGSNTAIIALQEDINNIHNLLFTTNDLFTYYDYGGNMPSNENASTDMDFTINGENYNVKQGMYNGVFNGSLTQTNAHTIQNLFKDNGAWSYYSGDDDVFFIDHNGNRTSYTEPLYNSSTGLYVGTDLRMSVTATNSNTYAGDFVEFTNPFLFKLTSISWTAINNKQPLKTWVLGSNDNGATYDFIQELTNDTTLSITHSITNAGLYKTLRLVWGEINPQAFGFALSALSFAGEARTSEGDSIITLIQNDVSTNASDITTANNSITTANTNIATNVTNIATNTADIVTANNLITTANTNIATNTADIVTANNLITSANTNITTNTADITTANTNIATNVTNIATNVTNIATNVTNIATNTADIITANNNIATNLSAITALQTADTSSKIETIDDNLSYTTPSNILAHTYNEENIFLNLLDDNNVIQLDLTISNPINYKSYIQKLIIDCLEFKGYVNTLNINGSLVEIKHKNGDTNINLAPIAGYSTIVQTFNLTRMNDTWYAMSDIRLFYNSVSNTAYDVTPPVITLIGNAVVNHEINTTYNDAGASANDNLDGDITGNIVIVNPVNTSVLGQYTITYNVEDTKGLSATQISRTVHIIDTVNPIVSLVGDVNVDLNLGTTYTELGATATDNSLESLGVVIAGDVVDENTLGAYVITYTATDSQSNSHQITRTVNVITAPSTLQYSNPTTNLLNDVVNIASHMATYGHANTNYDFTETNNATDSVFNGDYNVKASSYFRTSNPIANVFDGSSTTDWQGIKKHIHGADVTNSWEFGQIYNADVYAYDSNGNYQSQTCSVVGGGTVVVNHTVTANGTQYAGEYFQITFPFEIIVNKFEYLGNGNVYFTSGALLGSNDNGTTYDLVSTINATSISHTENITTSNKYKTFRYVMMTGTTSYYSYVKYIKLFGDIYA